MKVLVVTSQWPTPNHPEHAPYLADQVRSLQQIGIDIDVLHYRGGFNPQNYFSAWQELRNRIYENHYDIIHGHFGVGGLPALFAGKRARPLVVTFHGSDLNGIHDSMGHLTAEGFILRKISQLVARFADEIILVSQSMARFSPRKDYHLIPCGIDFETFKPINRTEAQRLLQLGTEYRYILFTGGKDNPIKRYELAESAVKLLQGINNYEDVKLLMADGVNPKRMPLYYNAASALLITSSREGSPTVVKEALACNCPVASVDVGDVKERIGRIAGCKISQEDTPIAIMRTLQNVLEYSSSFEGRSNIYELNIHHTADQIMRLYKNLAT